MDVSRVSLRRYYIVICTKMTCRARNVMHFAAQAQGFVKVARVCRYSIGICVSGSGIEALFWRFWWMGVCSERAEIIPNVWCGANFVEAHRR